MSLMDIFQQAASALGSNHEELLAQAAQDAPAGALGRGLAEAFRSDQTPPFVNMVAQLFSQSSGEQQAGMLNKLLETVGPALLSGAAGGALGNLMRPGALSVTPAQASQLSPEQVQALAAHAEQTEPGVIDQLGHFYAEHPALVKTLGGAAIAIALAKLKESSQG